MSTPATFPEVLIDGVMVHGRFQKMPSCVDGEVSTQIPPPCFVEEVAYYESTATLGLGFIDG